MIIRAKVLTDKIIEKYGENSEKHLSARIIMGDAEWVEECANSQIEQMKKIGEDYWRDEIQHMENSMQFHIQQLKWFKNRGIEIIKELEEILGA